MTAKGHQPYANTHRHNVVAAILQWYALCDPDTSRTVATIVIESLDRIDKADKRQAEKAAT